MATLLIVEDDYKTNDAICEYLKPTGHSLIPAYDGSEALQLFRQNHIDLVVLDIMLPHISGLSVLHENTANKHNACPDAHRYRGRIYPSQKF